MALVDQLSNAGHMRKIDQYQILLDGFYDIGWEILSPELQNYLRGCKERLGKAVTKNPRSPDLSTVF